MNADRLKLTSRVFSYVYVNAIPEQECILLKKSRDVATSISAMVGQAIRGLSDVRIFMS